MTTNTQIALFIEKMKAAGQPAAAIEMFSYYYDKLVKGGTGLIRESEIESLQPDEIPDLRDLDSYLSSGIEALPQTVTIKLNGGLGTTMGLDGPKSLIPVKNNLTFLDITALQIRALREKYNVKIPLLLMNSFRTEAPCSVVLEKYPDIRTELPYSFIQHKFPKVLASNLTPARYPDNEELEWNPPGHGDLFTVLISSGVLQSLLDRGYRYAFVTNIDNLGATLDPALLGYFASKGHSFLMEVTERTIMDRKGGHLARRKSDGRLLLREGAQCPAEDMEHFQNIDRHGFFNTNNIWLNLMALYGALNSKNGILELPMIRNAKKLNPTDPTTPDCYQLESAMGSAISVFSSSEAVKVPRARFAPVKNCEELLLLWSDYYVLTDDYKIVRDRARKSENVNVKLDAKHYCIFDKMNEHFPQGAPSLLNCQSFKVQGDIRFLDGVEIHGNVSITNRKNHQITLEKCKFENCEISF